MEEWAVVVDGDWAPEQNKTVKNKLLKHFLSERKAGGGECSVSTEDGKARARVLFRSREVRDRVLSIQNHEITVDQRRVALRLSVEALSPIQTHSCSDPDPQKSESQPQRNEDLAQQLKPDCAPSAGLEAGCSVSLAPLTEKLTRDLLCILVENVCGLDEREFDLELIWDCSIAVVTFKNNTDAEKFMSLSQSRGKLKSRGLTATLLQPAKHVRVENLPRTTIKDMLDLYFEKNWAAPDDILMIQEEQAALLSFSDPNVVKDICSKTDLIIKSTKVKVYPYHQSLGVALMGADRPEFKIPEAFTENVLVPVWRFLCSKNLSDAINEKMSQHFCQVNMDTPQVKLSPLPSFLRQNNLTKERVENWRPEALKAFRGQMNEYGAFDCPVNSEAWRLVETEVRGIVKEDAELILDYSKGVLTVAASFTTIRQVRAQVEGAVRKKLNQIDREKNGIVDKMTLDPAVFHILNESGLQKAAKNISSDLSFNFDKGVLTIDGMQGEVFRLKTWILEKKMSLEKKLLEIPNPLQEFLQNVDVKQLSQDQFTSRGVCAFVSLEKKGIYLIGSSEQFISDAEKKLRSVLMVQTLNYQDKQVVKLKMWSTLVGKMLDTYNTSTKQTLQIKEQEQKIVIAGYSVPVTEVAEHLSKFIHDYSKVQERVRVKSCAVVHFIKKKKLEEWNRIAKDNQVIAEFDPERPKFTISGPRIHVHEAKSLYHKLANSLLNDTLQVQKPGAKKFFMTQGAYFLSTVLNDVGCAVILHPDLPDDDNDDECGDLSEVEEGSCMVQVKTMRGVEVLVRKADMSKLKVDAVVNAANEDLQHIGGLALALLNAAGRDLQRDCDNFIKQNGKLPAGQTFVTRSYRLPCKHVIHAVGPKYTENGAKLAHFLLNLVVKDCLTKAEKYRCTSVAIPAISSGIFGFPVDLCAETIAQAVREYCDDPENQQVALRQVHLVDNIDKTVKALADAVKREFSDLKPTTKSKLQIQGAVGGSEPGWETVVYEDIDQAHRKGPVQKSTNRRIVPQIKPRLGQNLEQTTAEGINIRLVKGNLQDQTTDVIVNTIAENMDLQQGAVSKALLQAAGSGLQAAVLSSTSQADTLTVGEVVDTDAFNLRCKKVFHTVCPPWDKGAGLAQAMLEEIIHMCLNKAERQSFSSVAFPALGTGNLKFPRPVVSALMLRVVHEFSRKQSPRHLRSVRLVVHPSDTQTVECFTREFKGQNTEASDQSGHEVVPSPHRNDQSQQPTASGVAPPPGSFGPVTIPSLGVYQMQMGHVTLEVSSGDITKESCDVIINSSNQNFTLKTGVSKAILEAAGRGVELECAKIVSSPGYQDRPLIITSAGQLPSKNIIHIAGANKPPVLKEVVYSVLKLSEENSFTSVAFPAIGTGAGGANPSLVAEAMVGAVEDFVKKKQPKTVRSIKILVFQTAMVPDFHKSMKSREGQPLEKGLMDKFKAFVSPLTSFLGLSSEVKESLVLESEEFEPTVFELCAENQRAISVAKKKIEDWILTEQAHRTITDPILVQLGSSDVQLLKELQKNLTVQIRLETKNPEEACIHLEGLTRDVSTAESAVRSALVLHCAEHEQL
ncbi:unnamed protein product [Knipowitschia caucasica]